jgi:hypothetical protein
MTESAPLTHANGTAPAYMCFNPVCSRTGTHFPVILFGPAGRIPGEALPYRLEIPKAVCAGCQMGFQAATFVTAEARAKIENHLTLNQRQMPDYDRMFVTWKSVMGPDWLEVKASGEVRFLF